jgi:DNA-binding MarR family transcriptional regulator
MVPLLVWVWNTWTVTTEPTPNDIAQAGLLVQQAAQMLQAAVDARLRAAHLNWLRATVLAVLGRHGPQPMQALARYQLLQSPSLSTLVDRMEQAGLVERTRHPTDRRVVLVALTAAGTDAAAVADTALAEVAATVFGTVTEPELVQLRALLSGVRDAAAAVAGMPPDHFTYATHTLALRAAPAA